MTTPDGETPAEVRRDAELTACALFERMPPAGMPWTDQDRADCQTLVDGADASVLVAGVLGMFRHLADLHPEDAANVIAAARAHALACDL